MLTVKQISLDGHERVWQTDHVTFNPKTESRVPDDRTDRRAHVEFDACGETWEIKDGTVFVMNHHGATVSRWDLGASPVPLRDDVDGRNAHLKAKQAADYTPGL